MAYNRKHLSDETIESIKEALQDLKCGKYYTQEEVETELGVR